MTNSALIHVPALKENGKSIVRQVWLGRSIELRYKDNPDPRIYETLSAQECQRYNPPTLAELRHAFFGKNPNGSFVSPEYRQSRLVKDARDEWTSTFLRDGTDIVEKPTKIYFDPARGNVLNKFWILEGGRVFRVELPPDGWIVEFDKPTGFPSRTSPRKEDSVAMFGDDATYFGSYRSDYLKRDKGVKAIMVSSRDHSNPESKNGLFNVVAGYTPDTYGDVGYRPCIRSAKRVHSFENPQLVVSRDDYIELMRHYDELVGSIRTLISKISVDPEFVELMPSEALHLSQELRMLGKSF